MPERDLPRRAFLARAGAAALVAGRPPLGVPAVEAVPTVFHGHPDGTRTLVRFVVRNSDAPAGRMRVFDERGGALLGTAGVLPVSEGRLVGELWLPLERRLRIRTELEYPGTRQPLRDRFTLEPTPRWTLHWLLLADPAALARRIARTDPLWRGVTSAALGAAGVQLDPIPDADPLTDLAAARIAWPAWQIGRSSGLSLAPIGSALRGFGALPRVLQASGLAGVAGLLDEPWTLLESLPASLPAFQRLVEERLLVEGAAEHRAVVLVPVGDDPPALEGLLEAWRQRFVAPVLSVGTAPEGIRIRAEGMPPRPLPEGARGLRERAETRAPVRAAEAREAFRTLARRLGGEGDPLEDIARALRYPVPGVAVFNPGPWGRSDVVTLPDGTLRLATDVPGFGYAFVPSGTGARWPVGEPVGALATIATSRWRVRVDGRGAIDTLVHGPSGLQLAGVGGLFVAEDARADALWLARVEGLGERLTVRVRAGGFAWTMTVTVYEALDVVDIATDGGPWDAVWHFDPAVDGTRIRWAEPLAEAAADGAFGPVEVGGWFAADGARGSLLVTAPDGALLRRETTRRLACGCPEGAVRLRLSFARPALPEDPWRAGALGRPLTAVPAPGTGITDLPTFGRLVEPGDPAVRLLGLRPAADGVGVIAYLHDLLGLARPVPLRGGLLPIGAAFACDLLERDREQLPVRDGSVMVDVPGGGVAAVRLLGG